VQLVVIAKEPRAGFSKTRLCPPFSPDDAARVAEASLADTLAVIAATPASRHVIALDGQSGDWLPDGFDVIGQRSGELGERLAGVFADCFAVSSDPVVVVGMDTPQVTVAHLRRAERRLEEDHDAVLGPAADGGYWLIGLTTLRARAFDGVPMSHAGTRAHQTVQLEACGYRVAHIDELRDVDTVSDASEVAATVPTSRFARAVSVALSASAGAS